MNGSARRPPHGAATEEVQMHVADGLHAVRSGVDEDTESAVGDPLIARHTQREFVHPGDQAPVLHLVQRRDVLLGDDAHVHRRLRIDVREREQLRAFRAPFGGSASAETPSAEPTRTDIPALMLRGTGPSTTALASLARCTTGRTATTTPP